MRHLLCEHGTSAPCEQCAVIAAQQAAEVDALRPIIARLKQRVADEKDKIIAERDTEIARLKAVAQGCLSYGGGYRDDERGYRAFQHGIQTVINALNMPADDSQALTLAVVGSANRRGNDPR